MKGVQAKGGGEERAKGGGGSLHARRCKTRTHRG